jgi:uncharacterized membrane protein HdeD (DUF308 family)
MEKAITKKWWLMLITGLAYVILGVIIWNYPGETVLGATIYIGITLLITGFSYIGLVIGGAEKWGWYLAKGVIDIVLGGIILFNPIATASMLVLTVGIWFVFKGAMMFAESFSLKKGGYKLWWLNLIGGILIMIFGWMITGDPLAGTMGIVVYISIALWIKGVVLIATAFGLKFLGKVENTTSAEA